MKPNLTFCFIIAALAIGCLSSCKDIIEPDISKKIVELQAPGDKYKSAVYSTVFWWNDVEDALSYHLQVVTPKFDSIGGLVLDTLVKTTRFTINLSPGNYQWRVQASNGSYKTAYSVARSFTIFQSSIKQQKVQLLSPGNNTTTNQSSANFSWGDLYGATKFHLEIDTNNFVNENALVYNQSIPGQQISFTFPKDQIYQWRVRAENDTAQAQWSVIQNIVYDHTPPNKVTLISPANDQPTSLPVNLQWNTAATASKYKLYVYKADGVTLYNSAFPVSINTPGYSFNLGTFNEKIYWRVTAIDAAGNESVMSDSRDFIVQ
ncbi:fibronectin type III domain-containing protein [Mucilaginibacter boryungensis]|uniref:Fibronectin type-III domain-containing protein n=1 Tax=Mucilaginibacter boryungensis TaxID=768480 RepID=A0ABR9XLK2_9SPHI|nr:hypothetical protein [Mucilaginibacter boryungensis]MBE9668273.1 hypothetical protein [Mucilaginibacter boryungensis]